MQAELIIEVDGETALRHGNISLVVGIISTVLGVGSIIGCPWIAWALLPMGVYGILKSISAMKHPDGNSVGTAGLVLSIIGTIINAIGSIYAVFATIIAAVYIVFIAIYIVMLFIVIGASLFAV